MRIVLVIALASAAPAESQTPRTGLKVYVKAVDAYVNGADITSAVAPLQFWTRKHFEDAIRALVATKDTPRIEAAAVFHLEIGIVMTAVSAAAAAGHFDLGGTLLRGLVLPPSEQNRQRNQEVRALTAAWSGVAASAFLALTEVTRAQLWLQRALRLAPLAPSLRTLEGQATELQAASSEPARFDSVSQKARAATRYRFLLASAGEAYATALRSDPNYAPAHIRRGRVLFLLGDYAGARGAIERGQTLATDPSHQYLATLFLGAVHEKMNEAERARASYERALAIAPFSQTATIALAHLELLNGRPDRAQALSRSFAAATTEDKDWWAYKNGGLDEPGFAALRKRVIK